MSIKFSCTKCGETIISSFLSTGDPLYCPACNEALTVPSDAVETDEPSNLRPSVKKMSAKESGSTVSIGTSDSSISLTREPGPATKKTLTRDFTTLLSVSSLISGIGWVVAVLAAVGFFASLAIRGDMKFMGMILSVVGIAQGIVIVAFGQLISCIVSIERNTFSTFRAVESGSH